MHRILTILVLLLIAIQPGCATLMPRRSQVYSCADSAFGANAVVNIDEDNRRYFVVQRRLRVNQFKRMLRRAQQCLRGGQWEKSWSVSVFDDKELAGYKDSFYRRDLVDWARSYLAEYDRKSRLLTIRPADKRPIQTTFTP